MRILGWSWLFGLGAVFSANASAQALPTYPITNGPPSTTEWAVDRYAPARFENGGTVAGRVNTLILGVAEADGPGNRPQPQSSNFFNTQGRRLRILDWSSRPYSFIGSVRIPGAWAQSTGLIDSRRTDMWSVLSPNGSQVIAQSLFGIIGFANEGVAPAGFRQPDERAHMPPEYMPEGGGSGRYRVFDSHAAGGWQNLALPVRYDAWTDFCVTFTGNTLEYRIDGDLVYVDNTLTVNIGGVPTPVDGFMEVIMQAQNYGQRPTPPGGIAGVTYDSNWSSLAAGPGTCADVAIGTEFSADIRVTKTATPAQLAVGDVVTFTVDVTNNGPSNATEVIAVDTLPPQVEYLGNTCGASYAAPNMTWSIGNLNTGASVSCNITATVTTAGSFVNVVVVSGNQIDPVTANNSAAAGVSASEPRSVAVPALGQNGTIALLTLIGLLGLTLARRASR
jgi:uncharacterized repeat protein (TIGR01451 family)